jgi:hypothetical protein
MRRDCASPNKRAAQHGPGTSRRTRRGTSNERPNHWDTYETDVARLMTSHIVGDTNAPVHARELDTCSDQIAGCEHAATGRTLHDLHKHAYQEARSASSNLRGCIDLSIGGAGPALPLCGSQGTRHRFLITAGLEVTRDRPAMPHCGVRFAWAAQTSRLQAEPSAKGTAAASMPA